MATKQSSSLESQNLKNMSLNTNKAGMKGVDIANINETIARASAGSKFYAHKQRSQEKLDQRIAGMKAQFSKFTEQEILQAECEMAETATKLANGRDLTHTIVHIDMDMFYAAVEMRDDPQLRNVPMAVGSTGMLSTSNYAARKFGVRAAMPGFIGMKLCPNLKIVPLNFKKYKQASAEVQEILKEYDPNFSPMSLDEAYLDVTFYATLHYDDFASDEISVAEMVVAEIRKKIEEKTGLTASAGIAPNCMLAKICSDLNKPNGQYFLPADTSQIESFIDDLPIRKIGGIGGVTEQILKAFEIQTCKDLMNKRGTLKLLFSLSSAHYFLSVALGLGSTEVISGSEQDQKSISCETTFAATSNESKLLKITNDLSKELVSDMVSKNIYGRVLTLKAKTSEFEVQTKAQHFLTPCQDRSIIQSAAAKLLRLQLQTSHGTSSLRLLGVRMSSLCGKDILKQTTLTKMFTHNPIQRLENDEQSTNDVLLENQILDCPELNTDESSREPISSFTCPVCNNRKCCGMDELNSHMDLCLNRDVVQTLVQESRSVDVERKKESNTQHPSLSSGRKRKLSIPKDGTSDPKLRKPNNTISKYFQTS